MRSALDQLLDKILTEALPARFPSGQKVIHIGCGHGHLLEALRPSFGVGIDTENDALASARRRCEGLNLHFFEGDGTEAGLLERVGGPFDLILMVNVVARGAALEGAFERLHAVCHPRTRLLVYHRKEIRWRPLSWLRSIVGFKTQRQRRSGMSFEEARSVLERADYEVVRTDAQLLCPVRIPILARFLNRYLVRLPFMRELSLVYGVIVRPAPHRRTRHGGTQSVSVVIPCRNEAGHIGPLVNRLPDLGANTEFLFVEGHSTDATAAVLRRVLTENPDRPFRLLEQRGHGKGDAVRLGLSEARGDILLILDADMGVAPEDLPRFVAALTQARGELINGSRMVLPMEGHAMPLPNMIANKFFARLFTFLLGQEVGDTLCGTKALYRQDYERIVAHRPLCGKPDPFGDFELLVGAARLDLRVFDLPVRYCARQYGQSNISRFRDGLLLLRLAASAALRLTFA